MAAVIIPQRRIPKSEQEPPANPYTVPLSLTLVFVVVFLLDRACTSLCARWERSTQVIFCCTLRLRWFLALAEVIWKALATRFSCAGSSTFVTVWLLDVLFGASFCEVEGRLLCAAASNCELACAKLRSSAVFTSCVSTKRSVWQAQKFTLAGYELMSLLGLVVGGEPLRKSWQSGLCKDTVNGAGWGAMRRLYGRRCWAETRSKG